MSLLSKRTLRKTMPPTENIGWAKTNVDHYMQNLLFNTDWIHKDREVTMWETHKHRAPWEYKIGNSR